MYDAAVSLSSRRGGPRRLVLGIFVAAVGAAPWLATAVSFGFAGFLVQTAGWRSERTLTTSLDRVRLSMP